VLKKRKRKENPLLLPKSLKYLELSKSIKGTRVHVVFKGESCPAYSLTQVTLCCSQLKIHLSAVSEIMSAYFR